MQNTKFNSLYAQAIYVILTGLQLIFVPNMLLGMFGFPETTEIWIKVLGIVVLPLSAMYYAIAKHGSLYAVKATVVSRMFVGLGFSLLFLTGIAPLSIVLFAGIDIATALWTMLELRTKK
jgi:hypothetical protein